MAIIREPEGIDFVVEPHVLTDEDRKEVAAHIRAYKAKLTQEKKGYTCYPSFPNEGFVVSHL